MNSIAFPVPSVRKEVKKAKRHTFTHVEGLSKRFIRLGSLYFIYRFGGFGFES